MDGGIILTALFLLVLIDPFDKLLVVNLLKDLFEHKTVAKTITLGNFSALAFGFIIISGGEALITNVLKISLEALQFIGGIVLIILSTYALWKLYENKIREKISKTTAKNPIPTPNLALEDSKNSNPTSTNDPVKIKKAVNPYFFAIFPLAIPLIVGPAIITTTLTISVKRSVFFAMTSFGLAVALNYGIMLWALKFMKKVEEQKIRPFLIAIALFVLIVGIKMTLEGMGLT